MIRLPNYVYIDGQNLETALNLYAQTPDYAMLITYLKEHYKATKIVYCIKYTNNPIRQTHFEELKLLGYDIVFSAGNGKVGDDLSRKVNVDADLIVNCLTNYFEEENFGLVIISGDGDFVPLVRFFEKRKQFVKIIAPDKGSTSSMLIYDRFSKKSRNITFYREELLKLTKKISPTSRGGRRDN